MSVLCGKCKKYVTHTHAHVVSAIETGSGPGLPVYACDDCIGLYDLTPPRYIGRRDAPPTPPPPGRTA
jgi:hypothetical protein